jgi:putative addiction module component (TIGR02574 family)
MASRVEKLYEAAKGLSDAEREKLLLLLTHSMTADAENNGFASPEIEQAWRAECDRRVEAMDRGDMELIPAEEVFLRLREQLRK